jgi:hypothetical protein
MTKLDLTARRIRTWYSIGHFTSPRRLIAMLAPHPGGMAKHHWAGRDWSVYTRCSRRLLRHRNSTACRHIRALSAGSWRVLGESGYPGPLRWGYGSSWISRQLV